MHQPLRLDRGRVVNRNWTGPTAQVTATKLRSVQSDFLLHIRLLPGRQTGKLFPTHADNLLHMRRQKNATLKKTHTIHTPQYSFAENSDGS